MNKSIYISLAALAVSVSLARAQEVLTRDRCRDMAIENNKQMAVAAEQKQKAGYDVKSYKANYLPNISLAGNYLYTTTSFKKKIAGGYLPTYVPDGSGNLVPNILTTSGGTPIFKEYAYFPDMDIDLKLSGTYTAGVSVEQPIYMGGKVASAYRMSKLSDEIAGLNQTLTRAEIIEQTDKSYWQHVQARELLKSAQDYKKVVEELLRDIQNSYDVGMISRNDLLKVQVKLNEAELQVTQAENGVRLSRMNLCHMVGLPLLSAIEVAGLTEEPEVAITNTSDVTARPEYAMLSKQIELKEEQKRLARSEHLPNVGVVGNFGYANGLKFNGDKLLDKTSFSAVVSVSIPVFHWGEGRNKVRSAESDKRIAALQRDDATEKMELELSRAINTYHEAVVEDELTTRSLSQAEENLKVSRDFYDVGMETLANLLEAQTLWQQAWAEQVRAKTSLRLSETQYLKAIGEL